MAAPEEITLELLYQTGIEVFRELADYEQWLNSEIPNLDGRIPSSLMHTAAGRKECYTALNAIMHGIYL